MSQRDGKLKAVRARWQLQQRRLEAHLAIAQAALDDLNQRYAQLEQLQLDYRQRRCQAIDENVSLLATLSLFDVQLSHSLAVLDEQRLPVAAQVEERVQTLRQGQRKLLGLDRYRRRMQETEQLDSRRRLRRRLNQVPWRHRSEDAE